MDFSKLLEWPFVLEHPATANGVQITDLSWLIVRAIGFVLVALVLVKWIWPSMVAPHLSQRKIDIAEAADQVQQTLRETEQMRNDYRSRLERIEDETETRMQEAVREATLLRDQILAEARITAEGIVRRGEEEVSRERAKAMVNLRKQFVEDIIGAAQYAAAKSLDGAEQRRLVDDFARNVQKVGAQS